MKRTFVISLLSLIFPYYSTVFACTDSDGGIQPNKKGVTQQEIANVCPQGSNQCIKSTITERDYCITPGHLVEYYCVKNNIASKSIRCEKGKICSNGQCQ